MENYPLIIPFIPSYLEHCPNTLQDPCSHETAETVL